MLLRVPGGRVLGVGLVRHRAIERAVERGERASLAARTVALLRLVA